MVFWTLGVTRSQSVKMFFLEKFVFQISPPLLWRISILATRIATPEYYKTRNSFWDSGDHQKIVCEEKMWKNAFFKFHLLMRCLSRSPGGSLLVRSSQMFIFRGGKEQRRGSPASGAGGPEWRRQPWKSCWPGMGRKRLKRRRPRRTRRPRKTEKKNLPL